MIEQVRRKQAEGTWHHPTKPRRGTETPCPVCGKAVYANRGQRASGIGVYCSRACQTAGQTKEKVVKQCPACGKEIKVRPSYVWRVYCSKECKARGQVARPLDRDHNGRPVRLDKAGYVMLWDPDHPGAFHGWVYEHRIVAEQTIGRHLDREEHVHHVNGVKDDNRPENLQIMGWLEHLALSGEEHRNGVKDALAELEEYRRRFGPLK